MTHQYSKENARMRAIQMRELPEALRNHLIASSSNVIDYRAKFKAMK